MKIIIVGSGVAGAEAGTYLGHRARQPLEIVEIECEPTRRFGGRTCRARRSASGAPADRWFSYGIGFSGSLLEAPGMRNGP